MPQEHVMSLIERNRRDTGVDGADVTPDTIESVGIVGAGVMGTSIAATNIRTGVPVTIVDAAPNIVSEGMENILRRIARYKSSPVADSSRPHRLATQLIAADSLDELATNDLIIETVFEQLELKRKIYAQLEPQLADDVILASNTSTIPIAQLAERLERPERLVGIHFFAPVGQRHLVEVVRGRATSDRTIATAVEYAKRLRKIPIVVNDGPGFLVNRLLVPYMTAALHLIEEGVSIEAIEKAAISFGMEIGPISLYDIIGLDTAVMAGRILWDAFPDRVVASPIITRLVKLGRLGQKTGEGFFAYRNKHLRPEHDPALDEILQPYVLKERRISAAQITARLFLPSLIEATRILEEGIVRDVRDIDLGVIFGLGFPPDKGGPLYWADALGADRILAMLGPLNGRAESLRPTPLLLEMARTGRTFYRDVG
jgi:3-hydroxyacyl-CoA dehydrogenase